MKLMNFNRFLSRIKISSKIDCSTADTRLQISPNWRILALLYSEIEDGKYKRV